MLQIDSILHMFYITTHSQSVTWTSLLDIDLWPLTSDPGIFLAGITAIPPVIQILTLPMSPESPRYLLLSKNEEYQATKGETAHVVQCWPNWPCWPDWLCRPGRHICCYGYQAGLASPAGQRSSLNIYKNYSLASIFSPLHVSWLPLTEPHAFMFQHWWYYGVCHMRRKCSLK